MQFYLAAAPDRLSGLALPPGRIACAAYGIGADSRLSARPLPPRPRGGLLMLCDQGTLAVEDPDRLCRDIEEECTRRGYSGAVLDFEPSPAADRSTLIRRLDEYLYRRRLALYVPEYYGYCVRHGTVLLCTALSGGTLRQRLTDAIRYFAPRPIALDCQRLAMDFLIPPPMERARP